MALLHMNFKSKFLAGNTDVNILLPDMPAAAEPSDFYGSGKKYRVLWLLHGTTGDYTVWLRRSDIDLFASENDLAVVMPSAGNSDYINWDSFAMGYRAYDYFLDELMPLVQNWLPVSRRREDNFIGGVSMGGRGALIYGLNHPERFAGVFSFSAAPKELTDGAPTPWQRRNENLIQNAGGLEGLLESPYNIWETVQNAALKGGLPRLYFLCGTEDPIAYEGFCKFRSHAEEIGLEARFEEIPGYGHEWRLWKSGLPKALRFFGIIDEDGRPIKRDQHWSGK